MFQCNICNKQYVGNIVFHLDSEEHRKAEAALWERGQIFTPRQCTVPGCASYAGPNFLTKGPWFRHVQTSTHKAARYYFYRGRGCENDFSIDPQINEVMKFECITCGFKSFSVAGITAHYNQTTCDDIAPCHPVVNYFLKWSAEDNEYNEWSNKLFTETAGGGAEDEKMSDLLSPENLEAEFKKWMDSFPKDSQENIEADEYFALHRIEDEEVMNSFHPACGSQEVDATLKICIRF